MPTNKPEKHFKFGGVRVSVWRDVRKGPSGASFEARSVTLDRAYRDSANEWQNTGSMRENDIPKAILALQKAFAYMTEKETDESNSEDVEEEVIQGNSRTK
jgi:hypothetical protein